MNKRYHGFDFARAVFMLLGIFYHSSLIYQVGGGWRVSYGEQHQVFNQIAEFVHSFRIEAFYIVAGFFFVLIIEKYGLRHSLIERLIRLGIPLIVIGFTLNFPMNWLSYGRHFAPFLGYFIHGQWLGHLWFIGNLIFYYIVMAGFTHLFVSDTNSVDKNSDLGLDSASHPALSVNPSATPVIIASLLVAPLLSTSMSIIGNYFYANNFLFLNFPYLYKYFAYFVLGMYLWKQRNPLLLLLTLRSSVLLIVAVLLLKFILKLLITEKIHWIILAILSDLSSACLAMTSIIVLNFIGDRKSKFIKNVVDASYTIYLMHQPMIVCFFVLVLAKLPLDAYVSYALLCTVVLFGSYFAHTLIVNKSRLLLFLLNGKLDKTNHSRLRVHCLNPGTVHVN